MQFCVDSKVINKRMKRQEFIPGSDLEIDHRPHWLHMPLSTKHPNLRFPTRDLANHEILDTKQQQKQKCNKHLYHTYLK